MTLAIGASLKSVLETLLIIMPLKKHQVSINYLLKQR